MKCLNQNCVDVSGEPRMGWRAALRALAMPATRVHNYRNLHRTMFYDAIGEIDCKDRK